MRQCFKNLIPFFVPALLERMQKSGQVGDFERFFQFALPAQMAPVQGTDGQTAWPGTAVTNPPAVHVTDRDGNPVAGATVTFEVTAGGGQIGSTLATAVSDAETVVYGVGEKKKMGEVWINDVIIVVRLRL